MGRTANPPTFSNSKAIPRVWKKTKLEEESTLHQIAPYIGKLKPSIAKELVARFSKKNNLVVDPFSGSGTIPLEASLQGRNTFASDISPYAEVLTKAKLFAPASKEQAIKRFKKILADSQKLPEVDLRTIPIWVRNFFHPQTLREAIRFAYICKRPRNEFFLGCLLGILHHQRPGFLSYPSSHLTPYLRNKKFPAGKYPEMYEYRDLESRMLAKIERAYKTAPTKVAQKDKSFSLGPIRLPKKFDCLITSPPYMNALDYGRDNRLRLWFIEPSISEFIDNNKSQKKNGFKSIATSLAKKVNTRLNKGGYCVFVIGNKLERNYSAKPSKILCEVVKEHAPNLRLESIMVDKIPDIRRARRDYRGIKTEHFLVFKRSHK